MSNPTPPKPLSVREAGGRAKYLDLPHILAKHNGLGSAALQLRVTMKVNWTQIARDFNVKDAHTVKKWAKEIEDAEDHTA